MQIAQAMIACFGDWEDISGMSRLSLRFRVPGIENAFISRHRTDLIRATRASSLIGLLWGLFVFEPGVVEVSAAQNMIRDYTWYSIGCLGILGSVMFVITSIPALTQHCEICVLETMIVFWLIALEILAICIDRFYMSRLCGLDPYQIFVHDDRGKSSFSDTPIFLFIIGVVSAAHWMTPIRWSALVGLEISSILLPTVFVVVLGSPSPEPLCYDNLIRLYVIILCSAIGKRGFEFHERQEFWKLLEEKRLRSESEAQLSRS
jgi:hypothetical protein